jgi:DNA repair protein RadC
VTDFGAADGFRQAAWHKPMKLRAQVLACRVKGQRVVDVDLLTILLGLDTMAPAAALLDRFGSLARIERAGVAELMSIKRIDRGRAERLLAALALGRRLAAEPCSRDGPMRMAVDVWRRFGARVAGETREHFWVLALDRQLRLVAEREIAMGSASAVTFCGRDAFRVLVAESAAAAIFVHNHPSGNPAPSEEDRQLSAQLCEAGVLLGIHVVDHVIVTRDGYASALPHAARAATL